MRSHSLSHTPRPIAASSTERFAPLRCAEAWSAQIVGPFHRGVDLPPVDRVGVTRLATGAGVGVEGLGQRAEAAHLAGPPKRQAGALSHPSILGRIAGVRQLPVEHAAQTVGPDEEVAQPEVPVHRRPGRGRPAGVSQRTPNWRAGGPRRAIEPGRGSANGSGPARPATAAGSMVCTRPARPTAR